MRKSMIGILAVVSLWASGCLIWNTANAGSQPGGGSGGQPGGAKKGGDGTDALMSKDPVAVFDLLAKGRDFFLISETRSLHDPLMHFAEERGISNGQISRKQFLDFHTQYKAQMEAPGGGKKGPMGLGGGGIQPGGGKKGPMGPGGGQPGGFGGGGFGGGQPGSGFGPMMPGPAKPMTWEYRVMPRAALLEMGKENFEAGLNLVGAEGWELTGIETNKANAHIYIFRRPATAKPRTDTKPSAQATTFEQAAAKIDFRVYKMKHANAVEVGRMLDELMRSGTKDSIRIVADPSTNQLLVKGAAPVHADVQMLLERVDVPSEVAAPVPGKKGAGSPFKK